MQSHSARRWRNLQDTVLAAQLLYVQTARLGCAAAPPGGLLHESALLWLEADNLIRRLSSGHRSLDEFCGASLAARTARREVRPYDFSALVEVLNAVQPYDWRQFWKSGSVVTAQTPE